MSKHEQLLQQMHQSVLDGDEEAAAALARQGLDAGIAPLTAVERGYAAGINEAGDLWEEGEFFLPELVTAAQAMKAAMAIITPALGGGAEETYAGKVVIGTIQGDIHDIGKTLVATLLSAGGFEVTDEGADVPVERFVQRAKELDADLVCASALLTTTMTLQKGLIGALRAAGCKAKVMVGGAPVTRQWAGDIGADGYADSAVAAVEAAKALVSR